MIGVGHHNLAQLIVNDDPAQLVFLGFGFHQTLQDIALLLKIKLILCDQFFQFPGVKLALFFHMAVIFAGDLHGLLEGAFHLNTEPVADAVTEQFAGDKKQEGSGDQGQDTKRDDQLGLEFGADDPAFTLIIQFHQVAGDHDDQQHQQNDDDIKQEQDIDVVGDAGSLLSEDIDFQQGQSHQA